jgi:hypothetical protein
MKWPWRLVAAALLAPVATEAKGVVLEPIELRGTLLTCANSWDLYGWHGWSNLTLELVAPGNVLSSGQAYRLTYVIEAFQEEMRGAHRIQLVPRDQVGNSGRRYRVEGANDQDRHAPTGIIVTCYANGIDALTSLESVLINLIDPDSDPFERFFDMSSIYSVANWLLNGAALLCVASMLFYCWEHVAYFAKLQKRHRGKAHISQRGILKVMIIVVEMSSMTVLIVFNISSKFDSAPPPDFFISYELRNAVCFTLFQGLNLFTTMLVYSFLQDVHAKLSGKKPTHRYAMIACSFLPFLMDLGLLVKYRDFSPGMYNLTSALLATMTTVVGLLFISKSLVLSGMIKQNIGIAGPNMSIDRDFENYCAALNRAALFVGLFSLVFIALLTWFIFDVRSIYVPQAFSSLRFLSFSCRMFGSWTSCFMCRVPISHRPKHADLTKKKPRARACSIQPSHL